MHALPPLPRRTPPLHNRNDLFRNPLCEVAGPALFLLGRRQDPHECLPAAFAQAQRHRDLKRSAATGCAALGTDAHEGGDGVDGEREVEGWVEGEMVGGWRIWEKRIIGGGVGGRGGSEMGEDHGHVL